MEWVGPGEEWAGKTQGGWAGDGEEWAGKTHAGWPLTGEGGGGKPQGGRGLRRAASAVGGRPRIRRGEGRRGGQPLPGGQQRGGREAWPPGLLSKASITKLSHFIRQSYNTPKQRRLRGHEPAPWLASGRRRRSQASGSAKEPSGSATQVSAALAGSEGLLTYP